MLVATYEGEHNHPQPAQEGGAGTGTGTVPSSSSRSIVSLSSVPSNGSNPTVTLDLTKPKSNITKCNDVHDFSTTNTNKMFNTINQNQVAKFSSPEFQKLLAEQMASSLTKDPNFTAALAAAITGRFVQQSSSD